MIILKILLFCLFTIVSKAQLNIGYDTYQTNCKYLYINKNAEKMSKKLMTENLFNINSYQINLEKSFFKTLETDCFLNDPNNFEAHPHDTNYVLYGVDMSNNKLKDHELDRLIKQNSVFKYNFNMIKYLNLSNNNLNLMTSESSKTYLDNEINSMRDNLNLGPSDPGYLLNRFFSLESLIIDNNPSLNVNFRNLISIFPKLKVLSLNNCSTKLSSQKYASNNARLFYLGLHGNKLSDDFFKSLSTLSIEWLDLSANRISDLRALLETNLEVKHLSLENNIISLFDTSFIRQNLSEINLRYNLIQNVSATRFYSKDETSLKLLGNPLVCDCNTLWLFNEFRKLKQSRFLEPRASYLLLNRKKSKSDSKFNDSIKLVYRRSLEELSAHLYSFDDDNSEYLQRQKRKRFNETMIQIADIDQLTCSFLTSSIREFLNLDSTFFREVISNDFNYRIHYREKLISESKPSDFMCMYEDHCRRDNCDCCDFFHCHCRSICPSKCRCYFDSDMNKNIIDCSSINLIDIENEQPIELATDVRFNSNSLKTIKSHSFFGFTNVKYLYLQHNQISLLEDECFDDLKNSLKLVNLADNQINYLSGDEFKNFTQLEILILTKNPLKQIDRLDLFTFSYMQNLKLIFMESVNISAEKLDFLDKITQLNSNAILRLDQRFRTTTIKQSTTKSIISTNKTTISTKLTQSIVLKSKTTRRRPISRSTLKISSSQTTFVNNHQNLTNLTYTKIEEIYKFKNPFYLIIFILLISIFILSIVLISIFLVKRSAFRHKKKQYLNYVPKLMEQNDYQSDLYSDESESERKRMANIFRCHRKSTSSTDSCDSTYDDQYDSVSIPVSRSIECLNVYVYFNIIDNDYVANHLLPSLKKCATIIPEPKFILKPLKSYCISQTDTLSIDWSNESYSSYYSSIYGKKSNNVHAILMVLSENFLGYKRRTSESYVSVRYKTNPNLYSINTNAGYMSINRGIEGLFRKAFKIYLNNSNVWCRISTTTSKKTAKKLQRNSMYLNETDYSFIDSNYSSSAFDNRLVEKLQNYFQYVCLKSNFSNFSYVDYTKK